MRPVSPGDDGVSAAQVSGNFPINFGLDAIGATIGFAGLNGTPVTDSSSNVVKTSAGDALTYVWNAGTHTLSAVDGEGTAAFTLVVTNPSETSATGSYTFTLDRKSVV